MTTLPCPNIVKAKIASKPYKEKRSNLSFKILKREFNLFQKLDATNATEIENTVPLWLFEQANRQDKDFFISITRFDKFQKSLVMGWLNKNGALISYKHRRKYDAKWVTRKDTHPNQTPMSRIYDDEAQVYIVEGARDALTAILLGLNFIAIVSTGYRNTEALQRLLRLGDKLIYICEDEQGYQCMRRLCDSVAGRLISISGNKNKLDLSDLAYTKHTIKEVLDEL